MTTSEAPATESPATETPTAEKTPGTRKNPTKKPRPLRRPLLRTYLTLLLTHPIPTTRPPATRCEGRYGPPGAPSLRLALLGDSLAVSVGVTRPEQTAGARIATALAEHTGGPVDVEILARIGTTAPFLKRQTDRALHGPPGVAVLSLGANDALAPARLATAVRHLETQTARLVDAGWTVVVGCCPELSGLPALRRWARPLASRRAHALARRQTAAVLRAGAHPVNLIDPQFRTPAPHLLADDGFHPSPHGYAVHLERVLTTVLTALPPR